MEKVNYKDFPVFAEITRKDDIFFIHCGLCGLDLMPLEGRTPYIGMENRLKTHMQAHNRAEHWPDLKSLSTKP